MGVSGRTKACLPSAAEVPADSQQLHWKPWLTRLSTTSYAAEPPLPLQHVPLEHVPLEGFSPCAEDMGTAVVPCATCSQKIVNTVCIEHLLATCCTGHHSCPL